ncbi:RNA polymerase I-specific transcription initiation factor rrn7 [Neolecta irregularis DAH-3]|uniref:RNA polymerase I-specific transcription initiation factor rrn7 n=1 Tax=Neolecta irregularis (strain DAH-3) TaxID=1198029 RepID=A0A1U7LNW2_NEOID|nr:RNA polymerase I-specific transcription initiation factor rrn7 [Neolecta irregularis DAH-3]|eukprot:OLL24318.1 RNA polymerase I-specific transcription initiation factor rrn7 [Neolecta irregularis DAH-3]
MPPPVKYFKSSQCIHPSCKTNRFHQQDGLTYCFRGHLVEGAVEMEGEGGYREIGSRRAKTKGVKFLKETKVVYGAEGFNLFLRAYQLMLSTFIRQAIVEFGLPKTIECTAREFWTLYLGIIGRETIVESCSPPTASELSEESPPSISRQVISAHKPLHRPLLPFLPIFLYFSCHYMRLPLSLTTIHQAFTTDRLSYHRLFSVVPKNERKYLQPKYYEALSPQSIITVTRLSKYARQLSLLLHEHYKLKFSPLNVPMFLSRYIGDLLLPCIGSVQANKSFDRYHQTKSFLIINFFPVFSTPRKQFDGTYYHRYPHWENVMSDMPPVAAHISKVDADVLSMTGLEIDEYLAWFEKNWVVDEEDVQFPRGLVSIFPVPQGRSNSPKLALPTFSDRMYDIYGDANTCQPSSSEPEIRKYQRYRRSDEKPREYNLLLTKASEILGVTVISLERAIRDIERDIIQWIEASRNVEAKVEKRGKEMHDSSSERRREHSTDLDPIIVDEDEGNVYELSQ